MKNIRRKVKRVEWNERVPSFEQFWTEEFKKRSDISTADKNVFTGLCAMNNLKDANLMPECNDWLKPFAPKSNECGFSLNGFLSYFVKGVKTANILKSIDSLSVAGLIECPPYGKIMTEYGQYVSVPVNVRIIPQHHWVKYGININTDDQICLYEMPKLFMSYTAEKKLWHDEKWKQQMKEEDDEKTAIIVASLKEEAESAKVIEDLLVNAKEMTYAVDEEIGYDDISAAIKVSGYIENQGEYEEAFERLCFELYVRYGDKHSFVQLNNLYDHIHSMEMFKQYSNYEFHVLWNLAMEQIYYWEDRIIGKYDNIMEAISITNKNNNL